VVFAEETPFLTRKTRFARERLRKELSGKARRELEELLSHVLADPRGQEALRERIQKGLARKVVVVMLDLLARGKPQGPLSEFQGLLQTVIRRENQASEALWVAVSVYGAASFVDTERVFKEALHKVGKERKTAKENYDKYVFPHLRPDGGLPMLLRWLSGLAASERSWFIPLVEQALLRWCRESRALAGDSVQALCAHLQAIAKRPVSKPLGETDRLAVHLSAMHAGEAPALRDALLACRPVIRDERSEAWRATIEKVDQALGAVASSDAGPSVGVTEVARRGALEAPPEQARLADEVLRTVACLQDLAGAIRQQESVLANLRAENLAIKEKLDAACAESEGNRRRSEELRRDLDKAKAECAEAQEAVRRLARERDEAQARARDAEARAEQDVALARQDAAHAVATFKTQLWEDLKASLLEAQNEDFLKDPGVTPHERVLFTKLREILDTLRHHEVT
jgi:hypothetical protein